MSKNCLTCKSWVRIIPYPDTGYCGIVDEHPVKRLRFQYEGCEGYEGIARRTPYQGNWREATGGDWSNERVYRLEGLATK
jgi:hypothetical protein